MKCLVEVVVSNEGMKQFGMGFMIEEDTIGNMSKVAIEQMKQYISKNKKRNNNPTFWISTIQRDGNIILDNR